MHEKAWGVTDLPLLGTLLVDWAATGKDLEFHIKTNLDVSAFLYKKTFKIEPLTSRKNLYRCPKRAMNIPNGTLIKVSITRTGATRQCSDVLPSTCSQRKGNKGKSVERCGHS